MNSMTSADPRANTVFVAAPHNRHPVIPGNMSQVPQYPLNQPQVHIISGNPPGLEPPVYTQFDQRSFKEGKVLGALQILIGLIHIGLGGILGTLIAGRYTSISFIGGYPFWGGIWFIIAGSLTVASDNEPRNSCLLNGSLGLNIISAISSLVGIMLFIAELIVNPLDYYYPIYISWGLVSIPLDQSSFGFQRSYV
ncbi:membrane-spanning 4-domains subfamily A member 8 [Pipistrellus kuhlii]|uniref:membrane-spanning 4-domains subfamily A member 8 n=1 Tax=Pipistrellus kuhlii TaxID=59472 RepID=UPI00174F5AA5|nr:membrane-spanning 4-domains subfamily A member 8 [Pipistrellus kuhlii]XP_036283062.1 membrane-spanning 4-domains subfamily A member 8 [Pipistrellus kuhlii]